MKIFAEKVLGAAVGMLFAICPLSEAIQPFYTTRGGAATTLWTRPYGREGSKVVRQFGVYSIVW